MIQMRMNFMLVTVLIAAILAISGCTSPSPSPSPSAIVSPTLTPIAVANASPTSAVTATPSALPTAPVLTTALGNLTVSGISIDWDTTDILQHDIAHLSLQNMGGTVIEDVNVAYTVATPVTLVNPDGTSSVSNQTATASVYVGKMSPTEVKNVTIQSPDHMKNTTVFVNILVSWKGGQGTALQTSLSAPSGKIGNQTY
jgi:hypothetical protein